MSNRLSGRCSPGPHFFSLAFRSSFFATLFLAFSSAVPAQDSSRVQQSPAPAPASDSKSEISIRDSDSTFKLHVNLVQVRVVVRDSSGKPVENLRRENFEIYDQGSLQAITSFDVDTPESRRERVAVALKTQASTATSPDAAKVSIPERFVALTFDDVHFPYDDPQSSLYVLRVRTAASKFLQGLLPSDRVAVYCISGQCAPQEFTSSTELLNKAILTIVPHPLMGPPTAGYPPLSGYKTPVAENTNAPSAADVGYAPQAAYGTPVVNNTNTGSSADINAIVYARLAEILRRLAAMPGQRVMLLVSPGFGSTMTDATGFGSTMSDSSGIIGSANRSGIVINTLDARSLYVSDLIREDFNEDPENTGQKAMARIGAQFESPIVLQDFAAGTGGTFFQNSNDLAGGLARLGSTPEVSYLLGFSPQNQKTNGQFHLLKVKLTGDLKYDIQARRGYFAPARVDDPKEQARAEIEDAIYSPSEIQDFPLEFQTQYFKASDSAARLSVVSHLGVKSLRFRKTDDRNLNSVVIATAIFDENGGLVTGGVKNVDMRLLDATLTRLSRTGLTVRSSFELKPGKYIVRQVVRDSEGSQMAARNGVVVVPQ